MKMTKQRRAELQKLIEQKNARLAWAQRTVEELLEKAEQSAQKLLPDTVGQIDQDLREKTDAQKQEYISGLWDVYRSNFPLYNIEDTSYFEESFTESLILQLEQSDKDEAILDFLHSQKLFLTGQFLNLKKYQYAKSKIKEKPKNNPGEHKLKKEALRAVWMGEIIQGPGKLYQLFLWYSHKDNRIRHDSDSRTKRRNKENIFQSVIDTLPETFKAEAEDELNLLKLSP